MPFLYVPCVAAVEWSSARMTLCGGVCEWRPGGGCRIKLSEPLLKVVWWVGDVGEGGYV